MPQKPNPPVASLAARADQPTAGSSLSGLAKACDREFYQRELASFIPEKVYDAHTHLWLEGEVNFSISGFTGSVGYDEYLWLMQDLHPGRNTAAMFLSFAVVGRPQSAERMNEWIAQQTARNPSCRGAFFVRPDDDPEWVRGEVRRLGLHGLKCYHTFAPFQPTWEAEIPDFLPEPLVRVANDEGWFITLHMVRARACADPSNIYWIRRYCQQYPHMRLILAHSARGFQPAHNLEGLSQLTDLENLYFDTRREL